MAWVYKFQASHNIIFQGALQQTETGKQLAVVNRHLKRKLRIIQTKYLYTNEPSATAYEQQNSQRYSFTAIRNENERRYHSNWKTNKRRSNLRPRKSSSKTNCSLLNTFLEKLLKYWPLCATLSNEPPQHLPKFDLSINGWLTILTI